MAPAVRQEAGRVETATSNRGADSSASPCPARQGLVCRTGADGSFSLWSETFGEGFHSGRGALREARETFLLPSDLERFTPGSTIHVLEVCVGSGCNLAVLLEACDRLGLQLDWVGLELDPEPLRLALSQAAFRAPWQTDTLVALEQLLERGRWSSTVRADTNCSRARLLWGDARQTLASLLPEPGGCFDLIWHDAFSPQRCPQLWTLEFLTQLTGLLRADGRWISYCSAAAVRESLRLAGLQLAALPAPRGVADPRQQAWSGGTLASPAGLPDSPLWRSLTPMEREHQASGAGEPYRDPTGTATATEIIAARQQAQAEALAQGSRGSSSAWRRRWGVDTACPRGTAATAEMA